MSIAIGLVGLPNSGKTTLFNALAASAAPAESYPFCTVEKNVASVTIPDKVLDDLERLLEPEECVQATLQLIDIAGLVRGASKGEGLGNQFLEDIRSVNAIFHVIRHFHNPQVAHVESTADPIRDLELVDTELVLSDLDLVTRRLEQERRMAKGHAGGTSDEVMLYERLEAHLSKGGRLMDLLLDSIERSTIRRDRFLTLKPCIVVANVDEDSGHDVDPIFASAASPRTAIAFPAALEAEMAQLAPGDRSSFMLDLGIEQSYVSELLQTGFHLLDLITFYTMARNKLRAWRIHRGSSAVEGAALIHSDMAEGFIRSDVFSAADLLEFETIAALRQAGKLRSEGRDYKICDGDVLFIHFQPKN